MARKTTIYEVTGSIAGTQHWQFFTSRGAAERYVKRMQRESDGPDEVSLEVETREVVVTKAGLVEELNFLVSEACLNEG